MTNQPCILCHGRKLVHRPMFSMDFAPGTEVVPCPRCTVPATLAQTVALLLAMICVAVAFGLLIGWGLR